MLAFHSNFSNALFNYPARSVSERLPIMQAASFWLKIQLSYPFVISKPNGVRVMNYVSRFCFSALNHKQNETILEIIEMDKAGMNRVLWKVFVKGLITANMNPVKHIRFKIAWMIPSRFHVIIKLNNKPNIPTATANHCTKIASYNNAIYNYFHCSYNSYRSSWYSEGIGLLLVIALSFPLL